MRQRSFIYQTGNRRVVRRAALLRDQLYMMLLALRIMACASCRDAVRDGAVRRVRACSKRRNTGILHFEDPASTPSKTGLGPGRSCAQARQCNSGPTRVSPTFQLVTDALIRAAVRWTKCSECNFDLQRMEQSSINRRRLALWKSGVECPATIDTLS